MSTFKQKIYDIKKLHDKFEIKKTKTLAEHISVFTSEPEMRRQQTHVHDKWTVSKLIIKYENKMSLIVKEGQNY